MRKADIIITVIAGDLRAKIESKLSNPRYVSYTCGMWILFTALGFLSGEQISGQNKICFYDVQGSGYTLTIKAYQVCPPTIQTNNPDFSIPNIPDQRKLQAWKTGEEIRGQNKICYYEGGLTRVVIAYALCPISIPK